MTGDKRSYRRISRSLKVKDAVWAPWSPPPLISGPYTEIVPQDRIIDGISVFPDCGLIVGPGPIIIIDGTTIGGARWRGAIVRI